MENENRKYYQKLPSDRENDIVEQEKQETLSKTDAESQGNEREGQKQEELLIAVNGQAYSACPKDRPKGEYIGTVLENGRRYYYYRCRTGGYCYETDFDREMEARQRARKTHSINLKKVNDTSHVTRTQCSKGRETGPERRKDSETGAAISKRAVKEKKKET